jgi:hypothetical protein
MLLSLLGQHSTGNGNAGTIICLESWTAGAAAFLALLGLWTLFCYAREGRPSVPGRLALTLLRVAAAAALLVLLFEPTLRTERTERHRSSVAVLVDRSDSMALRDRWTDPAARRTLGRWASVHDLTLLPRNEWVRRALLEEPALRRLRRGHDVRLYAFAGERRPTTVTAVSRPSSLASDSTRMGDAISSTLDEFAGQPLAGIIVLSDGGSNRGEDPVAAAARSAEQRVPIFTVGIGDPTPPRDLAVASVLVDDVVRKGDEVPVVVGLKHSGLVTPESSPAHRWPARRVSTRVTLREDGRELGTQSVTLTAAGQQEIQFRYRPARPGAHTLQVSAAPLPGEITLLNNMRQTRVRVIEKRLRILYLESSPRWEYRYLKNAILRDPSIKLACLLLDSEPSGGGEGNLKISGFPSDRKALFEYDIVILGDVARSSLSDNQLRLLREFVEDRGGSLLVIAGESHMPWEYRGTPLEALLPAGIPAERGNRSSDEPFQLQLTEAGLRHSMMQLEDDPQANEQRWAMLPGSFWRAEVTRVKPGASVLLEATGDRRQATGARSADAGPGPNSAAVDLRLSPVVSAGAPLVLTQPVGEGMTFLSLFDSTWRWRFRLGDTYFYRFWGQVLRTLTPHELPGDNRLVKLTVDRASYQPGEAVVLRARALTPTFHPVRADAVIASVTHDDGTRSSVRLSPLGGSPGVFTTEWVPPRPGQYRAVLHAPSGSAAAEAQFAVHGEPLERREAQMNRELLQRVAQVSGGRYLDLTNFNRLPELVPDRSEVQTIRNERPLWDTPLPLSVFSLLLVGEWVLRKRAGLL